MSKNKFKFGDRGIWHVPASEQYEAKDVEAVVLEQTKEGLLYVFASKPIRKGWENLTYRTATIFPSDFTLFTNDPSHMQKKIPFPAGGILVLKGSRYIVGQGSEWSEKKKSHVTSYYFIPKYEKCTVGEKCECRATFYGYETIGPRVYAVHRCIMGHRSKTRLIQEDGPELTAYLKKHGK